MTDPPAPGTPWLYTGRRGACNTCDMPDMRLWKPSPSKELRLVMFPPVCRLCANKLGANIPNPEAP